MMCQYRETLRQVTALEAHEALRCMDRGTYGICVNCGRQIPEARLHAKPEATRCVECQLELERLSIVY